MGEATGTISFDCPRCSRAAAERSYGPCSPCREELRAHLGAAGRAIEVAAYEPKMNVVANQVATKD